MAHEIIRDSGRADSYKLWLMRTYARQVLRDEFGRYGFLKIADPTTYSTATLASMTELNQILKPHGVEVTQIVTPKPRFEQRIEKAIEDRQYAEQEVEVQVQKRKKLEQEKKRKVQDVVQSKNQELILESVSGYHRAVIL